MSEKKIVVPDGMSTAAIKASLDFYKSIAGSDFALAASLEAALRWLSGNPIVPTREWIEDQLEAGSHIGNKDVLVSRIIAQWQRHMFDAPEPEVPEEIKDLLYNEHDTSPPFERHNNLVIEAFRRGQNSK